MTTTPKAMEGTWTLTAPDGRTWQAESPLRLAAMEQRERVPATVALQRIYDACNEDEDECVQAALEQLRRNLCAIGIVGQIDGYDAIRRESALDIVDRAITSATAEPTGEKQ